MPVTITDEGGVTINDQGGVNITDQGGVNITGGVTSISTSPTIQTVSGVVTNAAITGGVTSSVAPNAAFDTDLVGLYCVINAYNTDAEFAVIAGASSITPVGGGTFTRSHSSGVPVEVLTNRVIPVELFGVKGDGATDYTASAQYAVDAADANNGTVVFSGGTYIVSTLTVNGACTITGPQATIKQKVLGTGVGSPIINVTANNVTIRGLKFDGQAGSQPADGFSDSFNGGASSTGRAYRAAIRCDGFSGLTVNDCDFTAIYGACIAAQDSDDLTVRGCYGHDTYFELVFLYRTAGTNDRPVIVGNRWENLASGHASINADGILLSYANNATITGNSGYGTERNHIKLETCTRVTISGNSFEYNTKDNFGAIQMQGTTSQVSIVGNLMYNCGAGIDDNAGTNTTLVIVGNLIDTTTGSSLADGIKLGANSPYATSDVLISGNTVRNVARHGITFQGGDRITITNNEFSGQAGGGQLGINSSIAKSVTDITIAGNRFSNFAQSAASNGVIGIFRSSTFTYTDLFIRDNHVDAGGSANRGMFSSGDYITGGYVTGNYVDGQIEMYSDVIFRENYASGTVTWPTSTAKWPRHLTATKSWDPANLADGAMTSTTVTVTGAAVGDPATAGLSTITAAGWVIVASVTSTNTVTVTLVNHTGGAVDLGSGTLRADVWKH